MELYHPYIGHLKVGSSEEFFFCIFFLESYYGLLGEAFCVVRVSESVDSELITLAGDEGGRDGETDLVAEEGTGRKECAFKGTGDWRFFLVLVYPFSRELNG